MSTNEGGGTVRRVSLEGIGGPYEWRGGVCFSPVFEEVFAEATFDEPCAVGVTVREGMVDELEAGGE